MGKCLALLSILVALVAAAKGQDMTSMMLQMMGVETPPMPPTMPKSVREAFYPRSQSQINRQRALQQYRIRLAQQKQQQQQQQQQRQQQQLQQQPSGSAVQTSYQSKALLNSNPYSVPYRSSYSRASPSTQNSVYSPANMIRRPGTANAVAPKAPSNPYSTSRQAGSTVPVVRYQALRKRPSPDPRMSQMVKTMQKIRAQPKKLREAQMAGCHAPDGPEALLLAGGCRTQTAQMACYTKMMSCLDVGYMGVCCPYGMNRLAFDTMNYLKKVQTFVAEVA